MPNIKIVPGEYLNENVVECLTVKYIYPKAVAIGGLAVDPQNVVEQMQMVKEAWHQTEGKQVYHFILNFTPLESERITSLGAVVQLAYKICEYFADEYQIVFGVHDSGHLHIHFAMNTVNYRTGKKYTHGNVDDYVLADLIKTLYLPDVLGDVLRVKKIPVYYH